MNTFDDLCKFMTLEQFKNYLRIAIHISELTLSSAAETAISVECMLLYKGSFKYHSVTREASGYFGNGVSAMPSETCLKNFGLLSSVLKSDSGNVCN